MDVYDYSPSLILSYEYRASFLFSLFYFCCEVHVCYFYFCLPRAYIWHIGVGEPLLLNELMFVGSVDESF